MFLSNLEEVNDDIRPFDIVVDVVAVAVVVGVVVAQIDHNECIWYIDFQTNECDCCRCCCSCCSLLSLSLSLLL
jgi:hypothetical protein